MHRVWACVLLFFLAPAAAGQTSNIELYQEMAVACIGGLPPGIETVSLEPPDRMPYLRTALVQHWQDEDRTVFLADSLRRYPLLSYLIEDAEVRYERREGRIERQVGLTMRFSLTETDGRILVDDRCTERRSDLISRSALSDVEAAAYPETQAEPPQAGWFRRFVEPAVITAATAVAVYLFFSLRSSRAEDS